MGFSFSDIGNAISEGASAVADAASDTWEDMQDAGEDFVEDVQDTWNEGTAPIENAVNNGDFLGAVIGIIGAVGAIPVGIGGNLADLTTDVAGSVAGGATAVGGAILGTTIRVVIGGVTGGNDGGRGHAIGQWLTDGARQLGDWVHSGFDLGGNILEAAADIGAGFLIAFTGKGQCFLSKAGGILSSGAEKVGHLIDGTEPAPRMKSAFNRVNHFFVLMFENRSFDHMLGRMPGVNGLATGRYFNWDSAKGIQYFADFNNEAQFTLNVDVAHEYGDIQTQLYWDPQVPNGGFVKDYEDELVREGSSAANARNAMSSFSEKSLPILHTLAREFAVCDAWHSSLPGPTLPNRQFLHAATSGGMADSPPNQNLGAMIAFGGFDYENGTVYERLNAKCISWKIYYGDFPPLVMSLKGVSLNDAVSGWPNIGTMTDFLEDLADAEDDEFPSYCFIEPHYDPVRHYVHGNSQHPLGGAPDGEALLKFVYEILRASAIWDTSALIVTWDEHGGFYDHVVPPSGVREATPPDDQRSYESWGQDPASRSFPFDQLGIRVPAVVISPLIERATIDHTIYDHSSVIATLAKRFGFRSLTQRDLHANKLDRLFTRTTPRTDAPMTLPNVVGTRNMT